MRYFPAIVFCFLILISCKKDEELISGDIEGTVSLIRSDYAPYPSAGDIQVDLFTNSEKIRTVKTDGNGAFSFAGLPYGKYTIHCSYPGFIRSYTEQPFFHIGGYSPTIADVLLYDVPEYQISADSVTYNSKEDFLMIHLKVDGDTLPPGGSSFFHGFRVFMSNSPGVSSDNYSLIAKGFLADWKEMNNTNVITAVYGRIMIYEGPYINWESIKSQPIYMVLYPIANNQGYFPEEYLPGSLGLPSNEISFDWNEIGAGY